MKPLRAEVVAQGHQLVLSAIQPHPHTRTPCFGSVFSAILLSLLRCYTVGGGGVAGEIKQDGACDILSRGQHISNNEQDLQINIALALFACIPSLGNLILVHSASFHASADHCPNLS